MSDRVEQLLKNAFAFLETNYCLSKQPGRSGSIVWRNDEVAVSVSFDKREFYPFVTVARVVNGEVPASPGELRPETTLNAYDLDDVVGLRSPADALPPHAAEQEWNEAYAKRLIEHQAECVRAYCSDVLRGSFDVFGKLDKIVKERARRAAFQKWGSEEAQRLGWAKLG